MSKSRSNFRRTKLSLAVTGALIMGANATNALMVTDSLSASAEAMTPLDSDTNSQNGEPVLAVAQASAFDMDGNSASARAFGRNTGRYLATANAEERGKARAAFSWTRTITNDESDPLDIFLDVFLYGGSLNVGQNINGGSIGQVAGYDWNIALDGPNGSQTLFNSEVEIDGVSIDDPDNDGLGDSAFNTPFNYFWSSQQLFSNELLGRLAPNESFTIQYDLVSYVDGTNLQTGAECYGGFEEEVDVVFTVNNLEVERNNCSMNAFTGDPTGQSATTPPPGGSVQITAQRVVVNPNAIPEPTSLALLGAGLLGAAGARRKKLVSK